MRSPARRARKGTKRDRFSTNCGLLSKKKLKMTKLLIISLMFMRFMKLKVTILTRLQIKIRPKGLHKSLTPDPWPLTPVLSTTVEKALQIRPFLQNKANFRKTQMNVSDLLTRKYAKMDTWSIRKNEPKTNPNEPN